MSSSEPVTWLDLQQETIGTPTAIGEPPAATGNAIFTAPRRVQAVLGTGSLDSRLIIRPSLQWTAGVKTAEVGSAVKAVQWLGDEATLRIEMQQLETRTAAEIQRLSMAIDALRRTVEASVPAYLQPDTVVTSPPVNLASFASVEELAAACGPDFTGDVWVDVFDFASELQEPLPEPVLGAAVRALQSEDPAVRGAAGRAVAASRRPDLLRQVEAAAATDSSPYVKKMLRSALRAART